MRVEDFPGNNEIKKIRKAILHLEQYNDYEAIIHAKTDLYHLLKKREEWVKS